MNTSAIYQEAIGKGPKPKDDEQEKALDSDFEKDAHNKWLNHIYTKKLLEYLEFQELDKMQHARNFSCSIDPDRMDKINIHNIKSQAIREVINHVRRK